MWLAKFQRMVDELPDKYLEPQPLEPQDKALLLPDSKPVGQLTEEEKRLYGVSLQLHDSLVLEEEAHQALRQQETAHSPDVCDRVHKDMYRRQSEIMLVLGIVLMSLGERLGFDDYMIDGYDIYAVPEAVNECSRSARWMAQEQVNFVNRLES